MRRIVSRLFVVLVMAFSIFPASTRAVAEEQIQNFHSDIAILSTGAVEVTEHITYDFGVQQRHGIFRDIPYEYERNTGKYKLRITDISVKRDGTEEQSNVSRSGGMVHIKIGDPNVTITGAHEYVIGYTVKRAINFFNDTDELYWNVTGNGWSVPILSASAEVRLAGALKPQATCFVGAIGSREVCTIATGSPEVRYTTDRALAGGEGLTIVYGFPKGIIAPPTTQDTIKDFLIDNGALGVPVVIFVLMFYLWFTRGRDPEGKTTIVPQYEPPTDLSPLEMGVLIDERADRVDISAQIIQLAISGFIKITRQEKKKLLVFNSTDYKLELLAPIETVASEADRKLLTALFGSESSVDISTFKNKRSVPVGILEAKNVVYKDLVSKGYFVSNPNTIRAIWIIAGFFIGGGLVMLLSAIGQHIAIGIISGVLSGIIIMIFGIAMTKRTAKGVEMRAQALGLKEYITVAEKDRLAFHNAPERTPERFEKLLPYAIALGVDKAWSKQFEGIYNQNPSWYSDSSGHMFNAIVLNNAVNNFSSSMNSAMAASSAGSGGSGFSGGGGGGGFGGGGGGSW